MCSQIKDVQMSVRKMHGTNLTNAKTGETIYTPPVGEELLSNWERMLHEHPELDPLIRMAVMHYQFEAIHTFTYGEWSNRTYLEYLIHYSRKIIEFSNDIFK